MVTFYAPVSLEILVVVQRRKIVQRIRHNTGQELCFYPPEEGI
jgi:hypothetical protein